LFKILQIQCIVNNKTLKIFKEEILVS